MIYWKYFKYVIKHKWFVFLASCKMGIPIRGLLHDMSKFLPSEFIPYARYFYGDYQTTEEIAKDFGVEDYSNVIYPKNSKEDIEQAFDEAWLKHIHRNPHHYQYWILNEDDGAMKCLPMDYKYELEMIADWRGAGKAITGVDNLSEWFNKNKENIKSRMAESTYTSVWDIIGEKE